MNTTTLTLTATDAEITEQVKRQLKFKNKVLTTVRANMIERLSDSVASAMRWDAGALVQAERTFALWMELDREIESAEQAPTQIATTWIARLTTQLLGRFDPQRHTGPADELVNRFEDAATAAVVEELRRLTA